MRTLAAISTDALDEELNTQGWSLVRGALDAATCESIREGYERDASFRSRVVWRGTILPKA